MPDAPALARAPRPPLRRAMRTRLRWEIAIVLGLSLGASAVYSVLRIVDLSTRPEALGSQSATINRSLNDRQAFDLLYQLLDIATALVPVVLVLFLLWQPGRSAFRRIGLDLARPGRDVAAGFGLAALIGVPGLGCTSPAALSGSPSMSCRPRSTRTGGPCRCSCSWPSVPRCRRR